MTKIRNELKARDSLPRSVLLGMFGVSLGSSAAWGASVISTSPNTTVTCGLTLEQLEDPELNSTVNGVCIVAEWRDADYNAVGPSYGDWTVSGPGPFGGDNASVWILDNGGNFASTTATVPTLAVSVHLAGDSNDGIAQVLVDGNEVARLDLWTDGFVDFCMVYVTGLPYASHTFKVVDLGDSPGHAGQDDVSILGAAACTVGGCCLPDVTCEEITEDACNSIAGHYLGNGTPCTKCGACCLPTFGCELLRSDIECHALLPTPGHFMGNGTTSCTHNPDGSCKLGACCLPNKTCQTDVTEEECIKADGRFLGLGTTSCPDNCFNIPTVSEWGLVVMAILVLSAATVVIMRRRAMVRG